MLSIGYQHLEGFTNLYGIASKNTWVSSNTAVTASNIAFLIIVFTLEISILLFIGQTGSSCRTRRVMFFERDHFPHITDTFLTSAVDGMAFNNSTYHLPLTEVICFVTNLNFVKCFVWCNETYRLKYGDMSLLHVVYINSSSCRLLYGINKHVSFGL